MIDQLGKLGKESWYLKTLVNIVELPTIRKGITYVWSW